MQISIAPASDQATIDLVRCRLEEAGHIVTVGLSAAAAPPSDSTGAPRVSSAKTTAVVIAVADSDIDPAVVVRLWTELTEAERQGLPILAVMTSDSDIPAAVATLPHRGEWIRVEPTRDPGCTELLGALTAVSHSLDTEARIDVARHARILTKVRSRAERIRHPVPQPGSERAPEDETASRGPVFVAYSREDSVIVDDICSRLERKGYNVWRDTKSIPGGARWRDKIGEGISEADFVLVLLSSNVTKKPHYPKIELDLADSQQKKIIPVLLENIPLPPKGFEYILDGLECIEIHRNFDEGMRQLLAALGQDPRQRKRGARERALDVLTEARSAARRNELGKKAKTAATVTAVAAAGVFAAALAAQQEKQRRDEAAAKEQQAQRERAYRDNTIDLVNRILKEIELVQGMTPEAYRQEFGRKVNRLLGELKATPPPNPAVVPAHAKVVEALGELIRDLDDAIAQQERGDNAAWARAIERVNHNWATSVRSSINWLMQVMGASDEIPHNAPGNDTGSTGGATG
jgi:hypothetical protein